jgi:hypothetical protein
MAGELSRKRFAMVAAEGVMVGLCGSGARQQ